MCGIFGIISKSNSYSLNTLKGQISKLFILSESRGKEAAGIAINYNLNINVYKDKISASQMLKSKEYENFLDNSFGETNNLDLPFSVIGHSRLVTNGSEELNYNNQPVIKDGFVAIHNGICTNVDSLFESHKHIKRDYDIDTEIILGLLRENLNEDTDYISSIQKMFKEFEGTASLAIMSNDSDNFVLTTNNGSLYICFDDKNETLSFASEKYILSQFVQSTSNFKLDNIKWIKPLSGLILNFKTFVKTDFDFSQDSIKYSYLTNDINLKIENFSKKDNIINSNIISKDLSNHLEYNIELANKIKRCTKCLLPHTFPFISFDNSGVCNICNNYIQKSQGNREKELFDKIERYRSSNGEPDSLIAFSGGRDSSYGMHLIVNELKLKPITFTYDWGMVTDLARRNIARICGKLGIENILVSADIRKKRHNIKLNVEAWLKRPELGIIPLFMAGDKHFFAFMNKLKSETGLKLNIWSMNRLENTDFKSGFCGIQHNFDKKRIDYLSLGNKAKMISFYMRNFILNPSYLNSSIPDTMSSFYSYYAEPRNDYFELFDYIKWDEKQIEDTLINEYNWDLAPDTKSTWRIGDGTAPFYNYIYYTVAGFSENDTFRSNQIREGMITRDEALKLVIRDNAPRYESMKWYFDTIGVDFEKAIKVINNIPKLYQV